MRILITDSYCSSNRGDAAILDAMVEGLRTRGARVEVVSSFPAVATSFHDVDAIDAADFRAVALAVARADLVVSCGELNASLPTLHLARRTSKPYAIFGQTVGPLTRPMSRQAAREVLDGAAWICVRDEASAKVVVDLGVRAPVRVGVDAAVLGRVNAAAAGNGPVLGVTVRSWPFPGQRDPAACQGRYEAEIVKAADRWVAETGGQVRFYSTCTSYGGFEEDDRVAARRIAAGMEADAEVVEAVDLDFATLRGEIGACDLFLGTRMHALVFSTTAEVPSVGIACEQDTFEWMTRVGLGGRVVPIERCEGVDGLVMATWEERKRVTARLRAAVDVLRTRAAEDLDILARVAAGERPARSSARATSGRMGDSRPFEPGYRRRRMVADIVLGEGGESVLELGCSTGTLGRMLGPADDYRGIDPAKTVATRHSRFNIVTSTLEAWQPRDKHDVVVATGSLEHVENLDVVLQKARAALKPGGLAVFTLFNLAHISRALGSAVRHPDWTLHARPDDFLLALHEVGLVPQRVLPSSAGYGPAPPDDDEAPTDFELDGVHQLSPDRLVRLAHHWVVVCRAGKPQAGPNELQRRFAQQDWPGALRIGVELVKAYPWAARAWSDVAVVWSAAGRADRAADAARRAYMLDPGRDDVRDNLAALDVHVELDDIEVAAMGDPSDQGAFDALVEDLLGRGRLHSVATVQRFRQGATARAAG